MTIDRTRRRARGGGVAWVLSLLLLAGEPIMGDALDPDLDLTALDMKDLMAVEVTSAAKKEQPLHDAAAAIHIVTAEEILASGATTLPEALRLVPGLDVAQLDGTVWAISSRGFTFRFASKMLVLLDGRSVYTPLFAGVFWDVQDTLLADVERIEVIRGPGATLWGANAVNGVINVITKSAEHTHGGRAEGLLGQEQRSASVRYGAAMGRHGHVRVFGKRLRGESQASPFGGDANDESQMTRGGFRMDWDFDTGRTAMLQGDLYDGRVDATDVTPIVGAPYVRLDPGGTDVAGHHVLFRWNRVIDDDRSFGLQAYYDHTERDSSQFGDSLDTLDLELQHRLRIGRRHDLVWGIGARRTRNETRDSPRISFEPDRRDDTLINAFVQTDLRLGRRTRVTLGTKLEHNDFTGFELQPNVRALWPLGERHTMWAAVSRAIRSPARGYTDVTLDLFAMPNQADPSKTNVLVLQGNPEFRSEELRAHEIGYRGCFRDRTCLDVTAFVNDYDDLTSLETGAPVQDPDDPDRIEIPQILGNLLFGRTQGVELSFNRRLGRHVRLGGWYAWLDVDIEARPESTDLTGGAEGESPERQAMLQLGFDLPAGWRIDLSAHRRDEIAGQGVPGFTRVDSRLAWSPAADVEAAIVFRNMFDDRHQEFANDWLAAPSEIERSVSARLSWRF